MSNRTQNFILVSTLLALDAGMILLGWWAAFALRVNNDFLPYFGDANPEEARNLVLMTLPVWLGIFALCGLYDREELLGGPQEYGNVVKGCLFGFAALIIVSMFARMPDLARGWLVLGLVLVTLFVGSMRFFVRRVFYSLRRHGWFVQRALIVGTNDDARAIARQLTPYGDSGVRVLGFVDEYLPVGTPVVDSLRVVAPTALLQDSARELQADQVILVSGAMTWESFDQLLRGITVSREDKYAIKLSPGLYETLTTGVRVSYKNRVPLLEIERAPITGIDALLKGLLDYAVSVPAFFVTLPLAAGIALALRLYGQKPVMESSEVLGKSGRVFEMRLFKSVPPLAPPWARGNRFGQFLFATGLNKLPQLQMVLRGKMSLVGPRPVEVQNAVTYQTWLPNLLSLKPGLTGARVSSRENSITLEQEMRFELYYARNYSIWFDLQILFQTARRMVKRERVLRIMDTEAAAVTNQWRVAVPPAQPGQNI